LTVPQAIDARPQIGPTVLAHDVGCRGSGSPGGRGSRPRRARGGGAALGRV